MKYFRSLKKLYLQKRTQGECVIMENGPGTERTRARAPSSRKDQI